jgi:uncharacterized protein (DUF697 family)
MSDDADRQVERVIWQTGVASAALGVVLSPIPLADELILMPLYGVMTARIGHARGVDLAALPWRPIGRAVFAGLAARAVANLSLAFIPGVAAVANAVSAAALTRVIGRYADTAVRERLQPEVPDGAAVA